MFLLNGLNNKGAPQHTPVFGYYYEVPYYSFVSSFFSDFPFLFLLRKMKMGLHIISNITTAVMTIPKFIFVLYKRLILSEDYRVPPCWDVHAISNLFTKTMRTGKR